MRESVCDRLRERRGESERTSGIQRVCERENERELYGRVRENERECV